MRTTLCILQLNCASCMVNISILFIKPDKVICDKTYDCLMTLLWKRLLVFVTMPPGKGVLKSESLGDLGARQSLRI